MKNGNAAEDLNEERKLIGCVVREGVGGTLKRKLVRPTF